AFGIIGMCNWVYKWYKPGHTSYGPDQIADHFISLLEAGYLTEQEQQGLAKSSQVPAEKRKSRTTIAKTYRELRHQCKALIELIDEIDHTG
ncbi:MAG TPA: hypothetical protein VMW90_08245, partial [Acidobacteriota bacterium]|nr:hypothetical protein [Acidobacteriota bacterium]